MASAETKSENKKKRKWLTTPQFNTASVILVIISLAITIVSTGVSYNLASDNNNLQNELYNFKPKIIWVNQNQYVNFEGNAKHDNSEPYVLHCNLNQNLKIASPHYGYVEITAVKITLTQESFVNNERKTDWRIFYDKPPYEDTVSQGITTVTANLQLSISVFLNPPPFDSNSHRMSFPIGNLTLEANLIDLQNNQNKTSQYDVPINVYLNQ